MEIPIESLIIWPPISIPKNAEPDGQPQDHPEGDLPQDQDRNAVPARPQVHDRREQRREGDGQADPESPRQRGAPQDRQEREEHARPQQDHEELGDAS